MPVPPSTTTVKTAARLALAAVVILIVAACSGSAPPLGTSVSGVSGDGAGAAAFATPGDAAKPADGPINPFADPNAPVAGGRVVIANPTLADVMQASPLPEMAQGKDTAPVTIVQYVSMTCPHCRHFHEVTYPVLKREFIDTGKVRYILREFPIGKQSGNATIALRCAKPEKYFELYGKFMIQQPAWVSQEVRLEPIYAVAKQVGVTPAEWDACLKNQALISALTSIKDRGRTLGIIGTPNFFVNGRLVKSELSIDDIRKIVSAGGDVSAVAGLVPQKAQ
jgi:protein-disulfide isomerase